MLWKAEALIETGKVSDAIDIINEVRERARNTVGVDGETKAPAGTLPDRDRLGSKEQAWEWLIHERRVELGLESHRFRDLKRWGIAEENLNESRCGAVVGNASYPTAFIDENGNATSAFNPAIFTKGTEEVETGKGKLPCVVLLKSSDCAFTKGDYLWAIPRNQINLNSNLVQNPGY